MAVVRPKVWIHKAKSFKEAEDFDARYYARMSPAERLETVQFLREVFYKMRKSGQHGKGRKRLRGFIKII